MFLRKGLISCSIIICLAACQKEPTIDMSKEERDEVEYTEITSKQVADQAPSNKAKKMLQNYEEVIVINAVNTQEDLMIAFEIEHHERLSLDHFEKKIKEKIKKSFPNFSIHVSTDKKIVIELEQLENEIADHSLSKKDFNKKVKQLIKLSKEQT